MAAAPLFASDWPHLLGPSRDAVYSGPTLAEDWPREGPPVVWKVSVGEGYSNPIVGEGRLVVCHRLGDDLIVDCLDPKTGSNYWSFKHAMKFQDGAYFDNGPRPTPAIRDGRVFVHNTDGYLACLDLKDGKGYWQLPTRRQTSGNVYAANPIVAGDQIFLSGWYNLGALLLRVKDGQPEKVWHLDDAISTHYAAAIMYEGYIYGFHGHAWERGGPNLRCLELATGKLMWEQAQVGSGTICRFGDHLLILSDNGELQLAKASPKEFKVSRRVQVVGRTSRSYPAITDGFVYVKGAKKLVCLDLRVKK